MGFWGSGFRVSSDKCKSRIRVLQEELLLPFVYATFLLEMRLCIHVFFQHKGFMHARSASSFVQTKEKVLHAFCLAGDGHAAGDAHAKHLDGGLSYNPALLGGCYCKGGMI